MSRRLGVLIVLLMAFAGTARAADTDCPGGSSPCPYNAVSDLVGLGANTPNGPTDVAIASNGDFYVTDRDSYKIRQYDDDGTPIRSFGKRGFNVGQFDLPAGITLDGDGNVWVADQNNNRIVKHNSQGDVLAVYGGSQGSGDNQTSLAHSLDIAPDGHIWIADFNNHRIVELAADGTFIRKFGAVSGSTPISGTGAGEFNRPLGIVVTPGGDVWVADTNNSRLQKLPNGSSTWEIVGSAGSGAGEFFFPNDVDFAGGILYATQTGRTQRFSGGLWTDFGTVGGDGIGAGGGRVAIANATARSVTVLNEDTTPVTLVSPIRPAAGDVGTPQAVVEDGAGSLYIADTDADRIVKVDATTGAFQATIGTPGSANGQLNDPWGLDFAGGHLFVADSSNDRIQEFEPDGDFVAVYGGPGNAAGQFDLPFGVDVASDGSLLVADTGNDRVQKSNAARNSWTVIGDSANGTFNGPGDVAIASNGDVWVADSFNDRVKKLPDGSGTWTTFGTSGSGDGQYSTPRGIEVAAGHVYVADTNNARVQRLDAGTGAFEAKFGSRVPFSGTACAGEFQDAWGVAADAAGNVYVSDQSGNKVKRFRFGGSPALQTCDHTAPVVSQTAPAYGATVGGTPTFTGSAGENSAVIVRVVQRAGIVQRVVRQLSANASGGAYSIPSTGTLAAGDYEWEATQADAAGNTGITARRPFTVGNAPPVDPTLAVTNLNTGVPVSGAAPGANPLVDDDTPTFAGTAENGAGDSSDVTIRLARFNGSEFVTYSDTTVQRDAGGLWSATFQVPLPPDTYEVWASQVTNSGQQVTAHWRLQVTALTVSQLNTGVPVTGLAPGTNPLLDDSTPTFSGVAVVAAAGGSSTVTVHLDRFNGSTFVPDVHVFNTTSNANGLWTATAPAIIDETWRVRVTQDVSSVTRESRGWHFHLIAALPTIEPTATTTVPPSPPLEVTQLDGGDVAAVPVVGPAPGANPLFTKADPLISGTAPTLAGTSQDVQIHYDRFSGTAFVEDVHVKTVRRNPATGFWQSRQVLEDETWRVRVTQDGNSSAGWYFQIKTAPTTVPTPTGSSFPLPVQNVGDSTRVVTVPNVVGKQIGAARAALDGGVPNVNINLDFSRSCKSNQALQVLKQAPAAGSVLRTSEAAVQTVTLTTCDGGRQFLSDCAKRELAADVKKLGRKTETGLGTELLLRLANCKTDIDVKLTGGDKPSTVGFDTLVRKGGKAAIESTLRCSRSNSDFALALGEGGQIGTSGNALFGLAEVGGKWKLPAHPNGSKSVVEIQVQNLTSGLGPAEVYVDADSVRPGTISPGQVFLTDGGGHARLQIVATRPGIIRICAVQRVGETGVATSAAEIEVVKVNTGDTWTTLMKRPLQVTASGDGRLPTVRQATVSQSFNIIEFLVNLFTGRSRTVAAQAAKEGSTAQKARTVMRVGGVGIGQVTQNGKLIASPPLPKLQLGPCLTGVAEVMVRTTCPYLGTQGGHAAVGISTDGKPLIAEGEDNVVTRSGKLIRDDGATLIGNDGSTLVGDEGASLVGNDGASLIGNDGSTLIGNDGSTLIGNDGSTLVSNSGSTAIAVPAGNFTVPLGAGAISTAPAQMVAAGGLNLISNDGSTLVAAGGLN